MKNNLLKPKSIAVVGASPTPGKIGNILVQNLKDSKKFQLFAVNPKRDSIAGIKSYASVLDIEQKVDLAVIAVPAQFVVQIVKECAWHSSPIKNIVIISAGFSEIGKQGAQRERELKELAKLHGLDIVGPNCLGIANTYHDMNATFAKSKIPKGSIGLIAQSGAFTTALFDLAESHKLGFSLVATLGNKAGINENQLVELFSKDAKTEIIALYLENISDGKQLAQILKKTTPDKPVIIIKTGTSQKAQSAIQSHTGAMAGDSEVVRTALEDCGAYVCDNFSDFMGLLKLFKGYAKPCCESVAIVTNAGGPGVIATDLVEKQKNIFLFDFTSKQKRQLKKELPEESSVENPVDVLGDAFEDRYEKIINICSQYKGLGAVLVLVTPQSQTPIERIANVVAKANRDFAIPILPVIVGGSAYQKASDVLSKRELSAFVYPDDAIKALSAANKNSLALGISGCKEIASDEKRSTLKDKAKQENRKVLLYNEARTLAKSAKINIHPAKIIRSKADARKIKSGFPYVLKLDSPTILHKNTRNGVILNIRDGKAFRKNYAKLQRNFKQEQIIAQRQVEPGMEMIIGIKKDPAFGHVLLLGVGGIFTEILDIKLLWLLPTCKELIMQKIEASPISKIIKKQKIDLAVVVSELEKVAKLASSYPFIKELDINPIMVYPDKKPIVVDIKIIID